MCGIILSSSGRPFHKWSVMCTWRQKQYFYPFHCNIWSLTMTHKVKYSLFAKPSCKSSIVFFYCATRRPDEARRREKSEWDWRETCKYWMLPAVILANVRSLRNQTDKLQANVKYLHEYRNASILAFTETWLNKDHDNSALHMDLDPPSDSTATVTSPVNNMAQVCISTSDVREELCTPNIELLAVSLCPFYLPREFPQLFFILVYIHPRTNPTTAIDHIKSTLNKLEQTSPDFPKFILGDFKHCTPGKSLKGFDQYISCTTRLGKTLDRCYGSVPDAYRSVALPPLWCILASLYI